MPSRLLEWGGEYALPNGCLKDVFRHILELTYSSLNQADVKIYEQYIEGRSIVRIAGENHLELLQVREKLNSVDTWLADHLSKDRLRALFQIPKYTAEGLMLENLIEFCKDSPAVVTDADPSLVEHHPKSQLVESLNISTRTLNVLYTDKIKTVEELTNYSAKQLMRLPNCGEKAVFEIKRALSEIGLNLLPR